MTKYSLEKKLEIVLEYQEGVLGAKSLARKYQIASHNNIYKWVKQYEKFGVEGLKKRKNQSYDLNLKLNVLNFRKEHNASLQETVNQFNIPELSTILVWENKLITEGIIGLERSRGRPMSTKVKKNDKKPENEMTELEKLQKENEYLGIEIAYLKKLKALGLKDPRPERKKQE